MSTCQRIGIHIGYAHTRTKTHTTTHAQRPTHTHTKTHTHTHSQRLTHAQRLTLALTHQDSHKRTQTWDTHNTYLHAFTVRQ